MDRALILLAVFAAVGSLSAWLRLRRSVPDAPDRFDPADAGLSGAGVRVVQFSGPYCLACRDWERALTEAGAPPVRIDVAADPGLARKYGVTTTPLVLAVRLSDGRVVRSARGEAAPAAVRRVASAARHVATPA